MNIREYFEFIQTIESKVEDQDVYLLDMYQDQRRALALRCTTEKFEIQYSNINLDLIEEFPRYCLTVALGSYLFHLDSIYRLNLPLDLQDFLFNSAVTWLESDAHRRQSIDKKLDQLKTSWYSWVTTFSQDWSPIQFQDFKQALSNAYDQTARTIEVQHLRNRYSVNTYHTMGLFSLWLDK